MRYHPDHAYLKASLNGLVDRTGRRGGRGARAPVRVATYKQNPEELPPVVVAYNCGRPWQGDKPDMRFVGTGEGAGVLGAGVYFATEEGIAERYLKFGGAKHTVTIDTRGLCDVRGTTREANDALKRVLEAAIVEKRAEHRVRRTSDGGIWNISGHSPLQHGNGYAGYIFMLLGPEEGRRRIIESGVTGVYEKLPTYDDDASGGSYEIAVFDPSIVTLVERTYAPEETQDSVEEWWRDDDDDLEENPRAKVKPLAEWEREDLPKANSFWMDFELENGPEWLPAALVDAEWPASPDDPELAREVLKLLYTRAPGDY